MTPSPRPAKVTAAGVLLVVVGSNVLLVALAIVGLLLWAAWGFMFLPCIAVAVVAGWIPISVGVLILSNGVAVLRGQLPTTRNHAAGYLALGWGSVLLLVIAGLFVLGFSSLRNIEPVAIGGVAFVVLNVAAVLVAGDMLGRSISQYEAWRLARATPPPPPDETDEPEELPDE